MYIVFKLVKTYQQANICYHFSTVTNKQTTFKQNVVTNVVCLFVDKDDNMFVCLLKKKRKILNEIIDIR